MKYKLTGCLALTLIAISGTACSSKDSASSIYDKGVSYLEDGKYGEAATSFEQAVEKDRDNSEYSVYYGMALIKTGEYDKAVEVFDQAIKEGSKKKIVKANKEAYRGKGIAYYSLNKYEEAYQSFENALAIDELEDLDQDIKEYLGECYVAVKQYDKAITIYSELIKEDKKQYAYYINKAKALKLSGNEKASKDTLNEALKLKQKSDEDKYNAALVHYYLGNQEEATHTLYEIKDSYGEAYAMLGDIYMEKKDYDDAITYYEAYLSKEKTKDTSHTSFKLSNCLIAKKNYKKAIVVIEEALGGQTIEYKQQLMYNEVLSYEYNADFEHAYTLAKEYMKEYPADQAMARELVFLETR
ncbi:MAG: tetratricopeptide repeat protein [bacterium]|nr:tetratricopeptide repeat protein [bacterium]